MSADTASVPLVRRSVGTYCPRIVVLEAEGVVNLVNTNGLALIGPGSEWFWSMLQLVIVAVSLIGLYRQLRAQGAANALQRMEALQGKWDSERMIHTRLAVDLWGKRARSSSPSFDAQVALSGLCGFFENLADLEEDGHLTWKEIENTWGEILPFYWALVAPAIRELRGSSSAAYIGFERLSERAVESALRRGNDWSVSESDLPEMIETHIGRSTARLRMLRDIEAGVIPTDRSPQAVPVPD